VNYHHYPKPVRLFLSPGLPRPLDQLTWDSPLFCPKPDLDYIPWFQAKQFSARSLPFFLLGWKRAPSLSHSLLAVVAFRRSNKAYVLAFLMSSEQISTTGTVPYVYILFMFLMRPRITQRRGFRLTDAPRLQPPLSSPARSFSIRERK